MTETSILPARIDTVVPEVTGLRGLLKPPSDLFLRIRWLFLLSAIGLTALFALAGTVATAAAASRPPVFAIIPPLVLIALWLYGYRQQRFTLPMDVVAGAALIALGAALPDNRSMIGATYAAIWMRALYSTTRQAALSTAIFLLSFVVAAILSPAAPDLLGASVLGRAVVGLVFGVVFTLIATVLSAYQRAIQRERRLRLAGHALAEASSRQDIYAAAVSGARSLLADGPHRGVELAIGTETDMTVVGAAGEGAERAAGQSLHVRDLPDSLRQALHDGRPFEVVHAQPALWSALDLSPPGGTGALYALPLVAHGTFEGAIVVGSHDPLDAELKDDLQTLSDLVALAVESQTLLDARASGHPDAAAIVSPFDRARDTAAVPTPAAAVPSATPIWRLPQDLPARIRWAFLVAASAMALWVGFRGVVAAAQGGGTGALIAASAPVWLIAWWAYGYRRAAFPIAGDVVITLLVGAMLTTATEFVMVQPALFASVLFRAVYGTRGRVALATALHVAALVIAVVVAGALTPGRGAGLVDPLTLVVLCAARAVLAAVNHFVSVTLSRYERALARERSLRVAGALLVAATDRAHVDAATLGGARDLLRGAPGAAALVAVGSPRTGRAVVDVLDDDDMQVVTATGDHAAHAAGRAIHLKDLAAELRTTLHAGDAVDLPTADATTWQALDLEGSVGAVYAVPLHVRGALEGAIVVASDAPLDPELKDDLQTLSSLAALAVEDIVLLEQRDVTPPA